MLRYHRPYHYKTAVGKAMFIISFIIALILVFFFNTRKQTAGRLSHTAKVVIALVFVLLNIASVVIDVLFAD